MKLQYLKLLVNFHSFEIADLGSRDTPLSV